MLNLDIENNFDVGKNFRIYFTHNNQCNVLKKYKRFSYRKQSKKVSRIFNRPKLS